MSKRPPPRGKPGERPSSHPADAARIELTGDLESFLVRLVRSYYSKGALANYSDEQIRAAASEICGRQPPRSTKPHRKNVFTAKELLRLAEGTFRTLHTIDALQHMAKDPDSGVFLFTGREASVDKVSNLVYFLRDPAEYLALMAKLKSEGNQGGARQVARFGRKRFGASWPRT